MKRSIKKRWVLVLLMINCVAFCVNEFDFTPHIQAIAEHKTFDLFLFTDSESNIESPLQQVGNLAQNRDGFWPFEEFYLETSTSSKNYTGRFRGFFAGFDLSEFAFYNVFILGLWGFSKLW